MAVLLALRGDADGRLACSACRQFYNDDTTRAWPFERYTNDAGEYVAPTSEERFEVRRVGDVVQWREFTQVGRPPAQWTTFPGGTILCTDDQCSPKKIGNFRVFDPATGEEVGP